MAETNSHPLRASDHADDGKFHLLLAASGSVATIKIPNIVEQLATVHDLSIRIILTASAQHFLQGQSEEQPSVRDLSCYRNVDAVYLDHHEWERPWRRNAPILHIELRRWADVLVVAPLSANSLGKMANGLCDNLLLSVVRAWQVEPEENAAHQKFIHVAPAMNTAMWRHPMTEQHLAQLARFGWVKVLSPVQKELACGDTGDGAMCPWTDIARAVYTEVATRGIVRHHAS